MMIVVLLPRCGKKILGRFVRIGCLITCLNGSGHVWEHKILRRLLVG